MPDSVGNTLDTAQGILLAATSRTFTESIDPGDVDFYRFSLSNRSSFNLTLSNLGANLDVALLDISGNPVTIGGLAQTSTNGGTLVESINTALNAGVYYIRVSGATASATGNYNLNALADNNTRSDLFWRNYANGSNVIWQLENGQVTSQSGADGILDTNWRTQAAADFNGDGFSDIVWRNYANGGNVVWFLDGSGKYIGESALPINQDSNWRIEAAADFNGDGSPDLVWRNYANGADIVWFMQGTTYIGESNLPTLGDVNFELQGVGDFNGDSLPDLVWRNRATGYNTVWTLNGTAFTSDLLIDAQPNLSWQIQGTGDFNRDGRTDLVWRNFSTGDNEIWLLNGTTRTAIQAIAPIADINWEAIAPFTRRLNVGQQDLAGSANASAFGIGSLNGNGMYRDNIGGGDGADFYQFSVGSLTRLNLTLADPSGNPLLGNAQVRVLRGNGSDVVAPTTGNIQTLAADLQPGTYFISVASSAANSIAYGISLNANNFPVLATNRPLTLNEGSVQTINRTLLLVTDGNNTADQLTFALASTPQQGSLLLDGAALTIGNLFSQAAIDAGRVSYRQNGSESTTDNFLFNVSDGIGGTIGNTAFAFAIVPTNDPPTLVSNNPLAVSEGAATTFDSTTLLVTDPEQSTTQLTYTLSAFPSGGTLLLNGVPLTANGTFTQADISSGTRLRYQHNGGEAPTDTFAFIVSDGAGGLLTPPTTTVTINVAPVNDLPVVVTNTGLGNSGSPPISEGQSAIISTSVLRTTDPELLTDALQDRIVYTIGTPPSRGTLFLNGTQTSTFTQADISRGRVVYTGTARGINSDRFTFTVADDAGGVTASQNFDINVQASNIPPGLQTNAGLTITEGQTTAPIDATLLNVTDPDTAPGLVSYTITALPTQGALRYLGGLLTLNQTFSQADLVNNPPTSSTLLSYSHSGSESTSDRFTFTFSDGVPGRAVETGTFSIAITPTNDPPQLVTNRVLSLSEGQARQLSTTLLSATDPDDSTAQISYTILSSPSSGTLLSAGTAVTVFSQAALVSNLISYQHNGSESAEDFFTFQLQDASGTPIVGPSTFTIQVTLVNDAPVLVSNTGITLDEGTSQTIANANLLIVDADGPGPLTYSLSTAPAVGSLRLNGVALSATQTFTQADITANSLSYTHNGSETPPTDRFIFSVSDGASQSAFTSFNITVNPINDPPLLTTPGAQTLGEDGSVTLTGATRITVTDPDSNPVTVTLTVGAGRLSLTSGGSAVAGNNSNNVTVTGTQTAINTALGTIVYRPDLNFNGPDLITVTADDGGGSPATGTINLTINPLNDAPTLTVSATTLTINEDAVLPLTIITTDVDSGDSEIQAILTSSANNTLTLSSTAGITFLNGTADGGATLSLQGTIASLQSALSTVNYQGIPDFNGRDTITVTVNDQGATGGGAIGNVSRSLTVNVTALNDPPQFTLSQASLTVNEDAGAQTITALATGISPGPANEASQTVRFNLTGNTNPTLFSVAPSLDAAGTLRFTPAANANGSAVITVTAIDSGNGTAPNVNTSPPQSFTITVLPVNDAPTFTRGPNITIDEDALPQSIAWARNISRGGGADEAGQTLTFNVNSTNPSLFTTAPTITPTGTLSYALAQDANGTAIVTVQLQDSGGTDNGGVDISAPQTFTINARSVNDAPLLTLPDNQVIDEDATLSIAGFSFTDVDAGTGQVQVNLRAANGLITVTPGAGVTATGNGTGTVQLLGNQADLNTTLNSFDYRGRPNFFGDDRLIISVNDRNLTGNGGAKTTTQSLTVTVAPVNDPPVLTIAGGTRTVNEDVLTAIVGAGITVTDPDSGTNPLLVTLTALQGTLSLNAAGGASVNSNGTSTLTVTGVTSAVNATLASLRYRGLQDFNGQDFVTVEVTDQGAFGSGEVGTDIRTLTVNVTAVNDAPTLTLPGPQTVQEDLELSFAGNITVTDVDAGNSDVLATVTVNNGTLTLGSTADLTPSVGNGGNGTKTLNYRGRIDAVQAALNTLVYRGNQDFNGSDLLRITLNDQGATGTGGQKTATSTVSIAVQSVNDPPVLLSNNPLVVNEASVGTARTAISSTLLRTTDPDRTDTPDRIVYSLTSTPANGTLFLNGATLAGTFTQDDVNRGRLSYLQNGSETNSDTFSFTVSDGVNTLDPATFNIQIRPVNDRPVLVTRLPLQVSEGRAAAINNTLLFVTDADNTADQVRYRVVSGPSSGGLRLNGTTLTNGAFFTQADVTSGSVSYQHNGSETTSDSFIFSVDDGAGGSISPTAFNIAITSVNDLPRLVSNGPVTVAEGGTQSITRSLLLTTDADNSAPQLRYTLLNSVTFGTLRLSGVALSAGNQFTQEDVDFSRLSYEQDGSETLDDFFSFSVSDGSPGTNLRSVLRLNVTPVDDSPELVVNSGISIASSAVGSVTPINSDQLQVTDPDTAATALSYRVVAAPDFGLLELNGTAIAAGQTFTQADLDSGSLRYRYQGGGTSDGFAFTVTDDPASGVDDLSGNFIISFT